MTDCPGCRQRKGPDGVWRPLRRHLPDCDVWKSDAVGRMQVLEHLERKQAAHLKALKEGCGQDCDHPVYPGPEEVWNKAWANYHRTALANTDWLAEITREEMRDLNNAIEP